MNCVQLHSASGVFLKQSVPEGLLLSLLLKYKTWMTLGRPFGCHSDDNY